MNENFQSFLNNKLKEKGLNLKRLSEISGIALKHLENLISGNFDALPPSPYLRGYLKKIGEVLDFDPEPWWRELKISGGVTGSGKTDELPKNRFAKKAGNKKVWIPILIGIFLLTFFALRFSKIFGRPEIIVAFPEGEEIVTVEVSEVTILGNLRGGDKILVNGEAVPLNSDNTWQKSLLLTPGLNTIEITAKKFLGQETEILRQIIYEPPKVIDNSSATSTEKE